MIDLFMTIICVMLFAGAVYYLIAAIQLKRNIVAKLNARETFSDGLHRGEGFNFARVLPRPSDELTHRILITSLAHRNVPVQDIGSFYLGLKGYQNCEDEIQRAFQQLEADDDDVVIAGSQTLWAYNVINAKEALMSAKLKWRDDARVREQLDDTLEKIAGSGSMQLT